MRRPGLHLPLVAALLFMGLESATADQPIKANRTLRVGTILTQSDVSVVREGMIGLEVRRAIYAGHPIGMSDLGPPTLVRRNDIVRMSFSSGGIQLSADGRALGAGGKGEVVDVMNLASRRTVRAVIVAPRQVEVRR